ncbi:MAG: dTDP-4-dehydrorhamnose reductase [Nitrospinae bacterium]|nr:dTDP-4-dehydrorhamnose reductase [Nitrospinota bacterium]
MKTLIIGASGMLGHDLVRAFQELRHDTLAPPHKELDITLSDSVREYISREKPQCVVLSAAFTRVDDCESQREVAFAANAEGPRHVAQACRESGAKLVYVSTDYVFNGQKTEPYTEDDPAGPINVYGQSKLAGENYIRELSRDYLIARTSWLYGLNGRNFVETILNKARTVTELRVVDDQKGAPTYTKDLAEAIAILVARGAGGIVNVANSQTCTWFEFARTILQLQGITGVDVRPVTSEEFKAPARRPANSILSGDRYRSLTGKTLRPWKEALADYLRARG